MKLSEFVKKLEAVPGSSRFDAQSIEDAAALSKEYTGRVVLNKWREFLVSGPKPFKMFSTELPPLIEAYIKDLQNGELISFSEKEEEKAVLLLAEYNEKQIREAWSFYKNTVGGSFLRFSFTASEVIENMDSEKQLNPFVIKKPETIIKPDKSFPGKIDPREGWMIGNLPVF